MNNHKANHQNGFTLIEVVVAVFVIAIGLGAVIKTIGTVTRNTALLSERTVAMWVAQNALAEFELDINNNAQEESEGTEEMIGIEWHWTKIIEETQDPGVRRVEFQVRQDRDEDSQVFATLVTLLPIFPGFESNQSNVGGAGS
jgi:general secretion pathway protein I